MEDAVAWAQSVLGEPIQAVRPLTGGAPAPRSVAFDADGRSSGVAAHLMTRVPGAPAERLTPSQVEVMGDLPESCWLVMDAAGFLPPPGREPLFGSAAELERLDDWLHGIIAGELP